MSRDAKEGRLKFGFQFGPCRVERLMKHPKLGAEIAIHSKRGTMFVRVTPSGVFKVTTSQ